MREKSFHIPDEDLLLAADNELPAPRAAEVRAHLSACWNCRGRMAEIESTISDFVRAMHEHEPLADLPSIQGPRALLKARLAQIEPTLPARPFYRTYVPALAYVAALFLLMAGGSWLLFQQVQKPASAYARMLPNPSLTPGVARPVALSTVCTEANDDVVRDVPESVQQAVFDEYGIENAPASEYEVDYLITPGLGGTNDIRNLWPEPHGDAWNSYVKDELEHHLHDMVCSGQIPLSTAQQEIASNWISAYQKYFHTRKPVRGGLIGGSPIDVTPSVFLVDFFSEKWRRSPIVIPDEGEFTQRASLSTSLLVLSCVFVLLIAAGMKTLGEVFQFFMAVLADENVTRAWRFRLRSVRRKFSPAFPAKIRPRPLQAT